MEWSPKVGHDNRTLGDCGCLGAVLVGAEVAEPLLNSGGVPPSEVVVQPGVKLVHGFGFLDAEPFLLEVAEEPLHDSVVQACALPGHRLGKPRIAQRVPPEAVTVLKSLVGVDERFLARALQPQLAHQFEHRLFRHRPPLSEQNSTHAPVPVGTLRLLECGTDSFLDTGPGVAAVEPAPVVVERRPGKVRELQQKR